MLVSVDYVGKVSRGQKSADAENREKYRVIDSVFHKSTHIKAIGIKDNTMLQTVKTTNGTAKTEEMIKLILRSFITASENVPGALLLALFARKYRHILNMK